MELDKISEPQKWSFCDVCRRNHEQGKKHIFSNHHKDKLAKILTKFSKKVRRFSMHYSTMTPVIMRSHPSLSLE